MRIGANAAPSWVCLLRFTPSHLHANQTRGPGVPSLGYVSGEVAQVWLALETMQVLNFPVTNLTDADLRRLLDATTEGTIAGKRWGAISRFLDWCQDAGHISVNPCAWRPAGVA